MTSLQDIHQSLVSMCRWLAVRVVWWDMRGTFLELLYRHRVTLCSMDHAVETQLQEVLCTLGPLLEEDVKLMVGAWRGCREGNGVDGWVDIFLEYC